MKKSFVFILFFFSTVFNCYSQSESALFEAVRQNDLARVEVLLASNVSVNINDSYGIPLFMRAVLRADLPIVQLLWESGVEVNDQAVIFLNDERTAYYGNLQSIAAGEGKIEVLRYLIEVIELPFDRREYNPESRKHDGWTALQWACENKHYEIVEYLIRKGADVNIDNGYCLFLAASSPSILKDLISGNIRTNEEIRVEAILKAIRESSPNAVNILLETRHVQDYSAINMGSVLATIVGDVFSFHYLYEAGMDTTFVYESKTVRDWAIKENDEFILWYLDHITDRNALVIWSKENITINKLYKEGEFKRAGEKAESNLKLSEKTMGEGSTQFIISAHGLAAVYEKLNRFEKAKLLYQKVLISKEKKNGKLNEDYVLTLNNLAILYSRTREYLLAETLFLEALEIHEELFGNQSFQYAKSLGDLAALYKDFGEFRKAAAMFKQAIEIKKMTQGKENIEYAVSLNNLASLYKRVGEYKEAEKILIESIDIHGKLLGNEHPDYATSIGSLGQLYMRMGKYKEAENNLNEALVIKERAFGKQDIRYANSLNSLAILHQDLGHFNQSEKLHLESLKILKETGGKRHPFYATYLSNFAKFNKEKGNNETAKLLFLKALELVKQLYGTDHPDYNTIQRNLATVYIKLGETFEAENIFLQSRKSAEANFGKKNLNYIYSNISLAGFYQELGDFNRAKSIYLPSIELLKEMGHKGSPVYNTILSQLGGAHQSSGDFKKAEEVYSQVLKTTEEIYGKHHLDYANILHNLGGLNLRLKNYQKSESLYKEALLVIDKILGKENIYYTHVLNGLASLYFYTKDIDNAETNFLEVLDIRKNILDPRDPDLAEVRNNLSSLYFYKDEYNKAIAFLKKGMETEIHELKKTLPFLSYSQQQPYVKLINGSIGFVSSITLSFPRAEALSMTYNNTLLQKQLLLESNRTWRTLIDRKNNATLNKLYDEWSIATKSRNHQLTLPKEQRSGFNKLEESIENLEKSMMRDLPEYQQSIQDLNATWSEVQAALPPKSAAIEFTHFQYYQKNGEWTDTTYYAALVLRPDDTHPQMLVLGTEKELDNALVADNSESIKKMYSRSPEHGIPVGKKANKGKLLYQMIWEPLDSLLEGTEEIYYSPSGLLHRLSFAGLAVSNDSFLCQKYELHQLGSTRELISGIPKLQAPVNGDWTIVGGLHYDQEPLWPDSLQTNDLEHQNLNVSIESSSNNRSLEYLKGSQREVDSLAVFLSEKNISYSLLNGSHACEEYFHESKNFKNTSVLHLATHGYFISESKTKEGLQFQHLNRPMLRSGLMLSGAEMTWTQGKSYARRMDGIWTAQEISQLGFKEMDFVVLSACETALGDLEGNEGVYGLQRAFKMAGAKKMLVSLWKVDDAATNLYMQSFYKNWLKGGTAYQAYHQTQLFFQGHPDYASPYYWAGFVLLE